MPVLGSGGQGKIYELHGEFADYVYKEYFSSKINISALERLIDIPNALSQRDRAWLLEQSAWPMSLVFDGGNVKGFIMRRVPHLFWGRTSAGAHLRELQYLLYKPKPLWGDIVSPDAMRRIEITRAVVELFLLVHSLKLVVGDISMKNMLWSIRPTAIYMLDCDGIREGSSSPVLPQAQTPDWDDPYQDPRRPDFDSDFYKLALIIGRVLTQTATLRPGQPLKFVHELPERLAVEVSAMFAEAGGDRGTRPSAAQWQKALIVDQSLQCETLTRASPTWPQNYP